MKLWEGQWLHLGALALLLVGVSLCARELSLVGACLGLSSETWLWIAIAVPALHQIYVWLAWRAELHYGLLTRWFGARAFPLYKLGFSVLIAARPISVLCLAISNRDTLSMPPALAISVGVLCLLPAAYLGYSIRRYFSLDRAYGIDHFDTSYRGAPLVREGIFRWSSNAMYVFGFLGLWGIALLFRSEAALLAAAFNHLFIWAHYFGTEKPDMRRIYGTAP